MADIRRPRNRPNCLTIRVVFSAALTRNAGKAFLQEFTGYRREYIDAIASNMANNGLWKNYKVKDTSWLREGFVDEKEFDNQCQAALGDLWYSEEARSRTTVDVIWIDP